MTKPKKNRAAVALGRKGGKARKAALSKQELSEIGRMGARAMHKKNGHRLTDA